MAMRAGSSRRSLRFPAFIVRDGPVPRPELNVIDALHGILELRFGEHASTEPPADSESLELVIAA
jgi:hypothetical protein